MTSAMASGDDTPTQAIHPVRRARLRSWLGSRNSRWVNIGLAALLLVAVVLAFFVIGNPGGNNPVERTATVTRGTVTESVTGSGNTQSSIATPVSFVTNGVVTAINVKAGDTVTNGQVLATIDPTTANFALQTAQAQLAQDQAAYAQAAAGPTAVKQQQDQAAIAQAQTALGTSQEALDNVKKQQSIDQDTLSTAVDNAQKAFDIAQRSANSSVSAAQASFNTTQAQQNQAVSNACTTTSTSTSTSTSTATSPSSAASSPTTSVIQGLLGTGSSSKSSSSTSTPTTTAMAAPVQLQAYSIPMAGSDSTACQNAKNVRDATLREAQTSVTTAKNSAAADVNTARTNLDAAKANQTSTLAKDQGSVISAQQAVNSDQATLTNAQLTAQADLHPETPDQIAQAKALVDSAQVNVNSAQQTVDDTTIKAPQDGVVLSVTGHVGELSTGGSSSTSGTTSTSTTNSAASASASSSPTGFIVLANPSQLAVIANIAEADAAKIKLGQPSTVTFPATGTTAQGSVTQITPQSTVTNNVVLYPVQVSLNSAPPGVGVGATANLSVTTNTVSDALEAPTTAITTIGNRHTVTVRRNGQDTVVPVEIGVEGDTTTQITSGVNEGDVLVLPTVQTGTAGATTGGTGARTGGG